MFFHAAFWSDMNAQFTHRFLRHLIQEPHAGFLHGNLTMVAKISHQAIKSLSCGDVAAFLSRYMVTGLRLMVSELMLTQTRALKYASKSDTPAQLLDLMLWHGIEFLTIMVLSAEQVAGVQETSSRHWDDLLSLPQLFRC